MSISDFSSTDTGFKLEPLGPGVAMKWGDDLRISEVLRNAKAQLRGIELTPENFCEAFRRVAVLQKKRLVNEYFENVWSITREEYLAGKLSHLPESDKSSVAAEVRRIDLEGGIIVGLFLDGKPFLIEVCRDGSVIQHEHFATQGTGATLALANMYYRRYSNGMSLDTAKYIVFESKKLSESESHVGSTTHLLSFSAGQTTAPLASYKDMHFLDHAFRRFGPQPVPPDMGAIRLKHEERYQKFLGETSHRVVESDTKSKQERDAQENDNRATSEHGIIPERSNE